MASHPSGCGSPRAAQCPTMALLGGYLVPISSPEATVCAGWRLIPAQLCSAHRGPVFSLKGIQILLQLLDGGLRICCYFYFHLY